MATQFTKVFDNLDDTYDQLIDDTFFAWCLDTDTEYTLETLDNVDYPVEFKEYFVRNEL